MHVSVLIDSYEVSNAGYSEVPDGEVEIESIPETNSFIRLSLSGGSVIVSAKELQKAIENATNL